MPAAKCASASTRCSIASLLNSSEPSAASLCARRPPDLPASFSARGPVAQPDNTAARRTSATAHFWVFKFIGEPGPQKRSPAGAGLTRIHCYHCLVMRATYCCQVRFLWRCKRSFLRRLCLLILAFRRFFNEPIIWLLLIHDFVQRIFNDPFRAGGLQLRDQLADHMFVNDCFHRHPARLAQL